jgi:hypothetical protein
MPRNNNKKKGGGESQSSNPKTSQTASTATPPGEDSTVKAPYEISPGHIIVEQNQEMRRQDEQLVDLEASILNLRDASLTINQEVTLQNRLLDDVHVQVDRVQERQAGTQDRLRSVMQRSGTCKLWLLISLLTLILIFLLVVLK